MLEALLELLPAAVAELQLVFQGEGAADYIEVALRALQALGSVDEPTDLALAFDYRFSTSWSMSSRTRRSRSSICSSD